MSNRSGVALCKSPYAHTCGACAAGSWLTARISVFSSILKHSGWSLGRFRKSAERIICANAFAACECPRFDEAMPQACMANEAGFEAGKEQVAGNCMMVCSVSSPGLPAVQKSQTELDTPPASCGPCWGSCRAWRPHSSCHRIRSCTSAACRRPRRSPARSRPAAAEALRDVRAYMHTLSYVRGVSPYPIPLQRGSWMHIYLLLP
jgi:hypothetical protein